MIVKLINYNKKLETDILHTVIIDQIEISKNNDVEYLTLKLANETGIFDLSLNLNQNFEDLVSLIKALDIEIPLNYKLDLSEIELLNRNLKFKYSLDENNNLKFDFLYIPNPNTTNQDDEDDIPF